MINPKNDEKIGIDKAFGIYKIYIDYAEEYDKNIHGNNIKLWNKIKLRNLRLAQEAYDNLKK